MNYNDEETVPLLESIKDVLRETLNEHIAIINKHLIHFNQIQDKNLMIFDMDKIISRLEYTGKNYGHTRLIDIGMSYAGMGHYHVLSWDRIEQKYFYRLDGGSNGYDRQANEEFFLTKLNLNNHKDKLLTFEQTINSIKNGIHRDFVIWAN
jgi:hypothetical protein